MISLLRAGVTCAECGSSQVRGSRPHGAAERLAHALGSVRYHVCNQCGARGTHRGRRRARRVKRQHADGRRVEPRDVRAARARTLRKVAVVAGVVLLGALVGLFASRFG